MFNGRTTLRAAVVALAVSALIAPACAAHADPTPEELQAQIDKGNNEVEHIVEQYNKVNGDLEATQAAITKLQADLAPLQATMEAAQVTADTLAVNAYKTGGHLGTWSLMLGASSSGAFTDRVGTLQQISHSQQRDLAAYTAAKDAFNAEQQRLNETRAAQSQQKIELETRRKKIEGDIARLDDLQRKAEAAAAAAAAAAKAKTTTTAAPPAPGKPPAVSGTAGKAVSYAWAQLGKKYVWGAAGPNTFDCSGLTMMAWKAAGVSLPHNAAQQWQKVRHISRSQLAPGDLVFYNGLGHVGIYIGNNQIIHAPNSRTVVKVAPVDIDTLYGYGRVS
ncbi:NlpC/P60 family protein [Dactylosporangium sp. NBC_01737]|uniref:C40 family peptidase n=1 Tax=Dactylosporangium sp. NBC_01737 TaxID=2975959 RepID=UPI002E12E313|nr:NlpC/P60 family protein [Dactylosporangium sp. NBC_01737]